MVTQEVVDVALDNAQSNGYPVAHDPPEDVAWDLVRYDAGFEDELPAELVPYIENWQRRNRK